MIPYPSVDPNIVRVGPITIRWYGVMYLAGFLVSFLLASWEAKRRRIPVTAKELEDLYFYLILGLLLGARLGYVFFYNFSAYLHRPFEILFIWQGGMSFHGGLLGSFILGTLFCKKRGLPFFLIADLVTPTCPIGLGLGRIGNFINGELYGRPSNLPWAMVFPGAGPFPRHPSQLYEALLEGLVLFFLLWMVRDKKRYEGDLFCLFLILYGIFRIFAEFFREPDPQLGLFFGAITMGQILSAFMILSGLIIRTLILPSYGLKGP